MPMREIFEALPYLETDPIKVWDYLEEFYSSNFFDDVICKIVCKLLFR